MLNLIYLLAARLWEVVARLRHKAYDHGLLKIYKSSVPVVSIGNIAVGGTGKTSLVSLLALALEGLAPVAILSRGYRSQIERRKESRRISSDASARECGDEPLLLARKTRAAVWVGPDRVLSAKKAISQGAKILLLDDGMQHRRLHRDIEIVVVDGSDPLGRGQFFPAGKLRDLLERLQAAHFVVATHVVDGNMHESVVRSLRRYTQAPVISMRYQAEGGESLRGQKVGAFCGIGNPVHFYDLLRSLDVEIVAQWTLSDHGVPCEKALQKFAKTCSLRGAQALVCTEKDAVKGLAAALPIVPLVVQLQIVHGQKEWEQLLKEIERLVHQEIT